jgi:mono/diheme cytochrome c family protein
MTSRLVAVLLGSLLSATLSAQRAAPPEPLTGDPAIDAWVRTTFGQPVDPETLDDPIWGTRTLLALTEGQREGARLIMQRCNVCHGAAMNSMDAYGPFLTRARVSGREDDVRRVIMDGSERMPAFKYGLTEAPIDLIVDYLGTVQRYEPSY